MRKVLLIIGLLIGFIGYGQTHVEYISEPADSMALISKKDIDVINRIFREKNILDSLHNINEQIISELEQRDQIQNTIIEDQILIIKNKDLIIEELNEQSSQNIEFYSEIIKKEKCVKNSFQLTTGIGLFIILILIL